MKKEVGGGGKPGRNILKIANQKFEQAQGKEEETSTLRIHEKEAPGRNQELSAVGPVRGRARSRVQERSRPGLDSSRSQPPGCAHDPGPAARSLELGEDTARSPQFMYGTLFGHLGGRGLLFYKCYGFFIYSAYRFPCHLQGLPASIFSTLLLFPLFLLMSL